ncbi:hypothetical protein GPALN_006130 [Globodera pallida]|uniref:Synaptobrevin YKT6 n=1 Tax=Globodera pallida TaxID=36090 RepID=A0A183BQ19_GLOPA|nr:hypothetical protein GPALN_006130 [Globodera pallida]
MKIFGLMVLCKDPSLATARLLKGAFELSSFSFFTRKNVQEFMQFTAKLISERSATPSRSSVKEGEYFIHCMVRHDNLVGVCVTDEQYQSRVAFTLLNKVLGDFAEKTPESQWKQMSGESECTYGELPGFLSQWQNPRAADALTRVQDEVEETKAVLHTTLQSVLERGEKLDDMIKASENLSDQSKMFYTQARKMNKCCSYT